MAAPRFPNRLFQDGRRVLRRFGYRAKPSEPDWARVWDRQLIGDFSARGRRIPRFTELTAEQRAAAVEYMRRRMAADQNLNVCERLHYSLFAKGIDTDLVERYAAAREVYEECVEDFGRARERLDAMFPD